MTEMLIADEIRAPDEMPDNARPISIHTHTYGPPSLRIWEVTPYSVGEVSGITTFVLDLVRRLEARGHPTTILAPASQIEAPREDVAVVNVPVRGPFRNGILAWRTARIIWWGHRNWDVLHLHQAHPVAALAALAARVRGKPVVATFHLVPPCPRGLRRVAHLLATFLVLRLVTRRVFVSDRTRSDFQSEGLVIRNGVDVDRLRASLGPRGELRSRLGLEGFVVAFAGRRAKIKGYSDLLEAIALVRNAGIDVRLLAIGYVPEDEEALVTKQVERLGLGPYVVDLGERPDRVTYFSAADGFALPSHLEGFPMALLEAMAAGRPILATDVGGIPELVKDGRDGFLVRPGDVSSLANRIRTLATDPALAARLGSNALQTVRAFDAEDVVTAYLEVFRDAGGEEGIL